MPSPEAMDRIANVALESVRDGMRLGLGTGRAAEAFIHALGKKVAGGLSVLCVTTSIRSEKLASSLAIPLSTIDEVAHLDIAFDGADEVTPDLQLTKGLGGALLRERVIAHAADRFIILITPEKRVPKLASRTPIPLEVVPFAQAPVARGLTAIGGRPSLRQDVQGGPYRTDNGNVILDTDFDPLDDPKAVDKNIRAIPGIVDTGLFLDMADLVLIGTPDGHERLER